MISMSTKYEVFMFTHCEDMKGNAKSINWGGAVFARLGNIKVIDNITIQWSTYDE